MDNIVFQAPFNKFVKKVSGGWQQDIVNVSIAPLCEVNHPLTEAIIGCCIICREYGIFSHPNADTRLGEPQRSRNCKHCIHCSILE